MGNTDKTLQDKDYLNIYPITRERNVYDENNVNLKTKFENVVFNDNDVHKFAEGLRNESSNILKPENCVTNYNVEKDIFEGQFSAGDVILKNLGFNKKVSISLILYSKPTESVTLTPYDKNGNNMGGFTNINTLETNKIYTNIYESISKIQLWTSMKPTNSFSFRLWINDGETGKPYGLYNPNRHITNSEAEFLKEEFGKSVNLSQVNSSTTGNFNLGAKIESGKKYTISFYCEGHRNFSLKKNNNSGAVIKTSYDINGQYQYTFTADWTGDIYINAWASSTTPTGNSYSNIMVNEGEPLPYQPYNSASHITNPQADLLKSEWEKSKNYFDMNNLVIGTLDSDSGDLVSSHNRIRNKEKFRLNADSYIINFDGLDKLVMYVYDLDGNYLINESYTTWQTKPFEFKLTSNRLVVFGFSYTDNRTITSVNELTNVLLSKEGKIIHEKDIRGELMWENGTPNVEYPPTSEGFDIGLYDKNIEYDVYYKLSTNSNGLPLKFTFKRVNSTGGYSYFSMIADNSNSRLMRGFEFSNNRFYFKDAYKNGSIDNTLLIPLSIYRRKI